jgi:hypothetical protein
LALGLGEAVVGHRHFDQGDLRTNIAGRQAGRNLGLHFGALRPSAGIGDLVEGEPAIGIGGRGIGELGDAFPRLAQLIAVETRLRRRDLGIGPFRIVVAAGVVLVASPDRLVAH